jgi:iron(III) transport system permease protein
MRDRLNSGSNNRDASAVRTSGGETAVRAIATLTAALVALPVISIVVLAAQPVPDLWPHLISYVLPGTLFDTLALLAGVAALTLTIGAGTAWLVTAHDFPGRGLLIWLMPMPLAIPTYIAAYVYVDLFEPLGLAHKMLGALMPMQQAAQWLPQLRSLPGAIFIIGLVLYPYVYLSARAMFQTQGLDALEAARVLGARPWAIAWRVTLPMARPALAVGLALVSLETLNDIGASEYLGVRTFTVSIFNTWLNRSSLPGAAQIAVLALILVALLVVLERQGRRHRTYAGAENPRTIRRRRIDGAKGWLATVVCLLPTVLGFAVPLLFLIRESLRRGLADHSRAALIADTLHSLSYAAIATLIALLLGLAVVLASRWRPGRLRTALGTIARAGYALPGLVLALGLLAPLLAMDNAANALARVTGLAAPGLLLIGSGAAVVIAYVVRFLAVPAGFIEAGFARIPRDYDDSAAISGASRLTTLRKVHLPLLTPALIGAAIIVFVDCLKELPATLLLRPMNVETLATSIYQYASRGSFEDGALAALLIVAASIGPVAWLARFSDVPDGPA